jgi:23S rRNA (uridine2552-2'-O)-methyltransferase
VNLHSILLKSFGPNGQFVVKVFQGTGFDEFRKQVVDSFDVLKTAKPAASRARSKEVFCWARA